LRRSATDLSSSTRYALDHPVPDFDGEEQSEPILILVRDLTDFERGGQCIDGSGAGMNNAGG